MSRLKKVDILTRLSTAYTTEDVSEAVTEIRRLRREMGVLKSSHRLYRIEMASDAECAASKECFSSLISAESKRRWIDDRDLFMADGRVFAAVDTAKRIYFMDAITGSLYNFGECLTSVHGRTGFVRNREAAIKYLMGFKGASTNGGGDGDA